MVPADVVGAVTVPALVLTGGPSPAWMNDTGREIADALPDGERSVLEDQGHLVASEVLAPVLPEFFAD